MLQWMLVDVQQQRQHMQWRQANTKANTLAISFAISFAVSFWFMCEQRSLEKV
jgi:hypothetical protein